MKAIILVKAQVGMLHDVVSELNLIEGVEIADEVTGPYDIIVIVNASDLNAIGNLVTRQMQIIPGLSKTTTCLSLNGRKKD